MILNRADRMLNIALRKQCYVALNRYIMIFSKLSYSDSSLVKIKEPLKIKELGDDFSSAKKKGKFKKCFIENLFINKFQEDILEYPELRSLKQVEAMKQKCYLAQQLLDGTNGLVKYVSKSDLSDSINTIRTHELTGFKLPRTKRGFGYVDSEFSFMQEALGLNPSLAKTVSENDDFGTQLISVYGNETQKEKYLKKLGSGETITCLAHLESEPFAILDPDLIKTTAEMSSDKLSYIISGEKKWIYNAKYVDVFILSANVTTENKDGVKETKPTLFLVPKDVPGLKIQDPINTMALKHLSISNVSFDKVVVPSSSVLGGVQAGGSILREILSKGKLNNGAHCLPIMRELVNMAIEHCIHADFFKKSKYEKKYYKRIVAEIVSEVYAVESMTYLVTGRIDHFLNSDLFLESLIAKIFASESLQSVLQKCIGIIGQEIITSDSNWKQIINDSQFYAAADIANDHLRLLLAITGLQHAMENKKKKNIFQKKVSDVIIGFNKFFQTGRDTRVVYKDILPGYIHCILRNEGLALEDGVRWLYESTEDLIKSHGENVFKMHWELKTLADIVINIYAETSVLARASRAYCLGVERSEVDRCIASALTKVYHYRINNLGRCLKYRQKCPEFDKFEDKFLHFNNYNQKFSIFNNLRIRN